MIVGETGGETDVRGLSIALATAAALLAGCVQLRAPDKPIEINLNVNIKQEVVVKLQRDVSDLIQQNPDLFPTKKAPTP